MAGPSFAIVEINPYAPVPWVFSDAAICLRDSIRLAGYQATLLTNAIDPDAYSIVLGAGPGNALLDMLAPERTILFNFEQLASKSSFVGDNYLRWLGKYVVFDYHAANIAHASRILGDASRFFEIPVVPSSALAAMRREVDAAPASVDIVFYGALLPRRIHILNALREAGVSVDMVRGAYGSALLPALLRARIVLSIHYYETALFPILRFVQPAVLGVPMISEKSVCSPLSDWTLSGIQFAEYDSIVDSCLALLSDPLARLDSVRATMRCVAGFDFASAFTRAINSIGIEACHPQPPGIDVESN